MKVIHYQRGKFSIKKNDMELFIVLFVIIFQSVLEQYNTIFSFLDEILAIVLFSNAVLQQTRKNKFTMSKNEMYLMVCVLGYLVLGTISSTVYRYQSLIITIESAFLAVKWFMLFYGMMYLCRYDSVRSIRQINISVVEFLAVMMWIWQMMYIIGSPFVKYGFSGWDVCAKAVFIQGLIIAHWEKKKEYVLCVFLMWTLLFLSGRSKGFAAICASILILFWVIKRNKKIKITKIILMVALVVAVAWKKIYFYFILGAKYGFARAVLFLTSFRIANDYFPIGTGWGTFGSYFAAQEYSPVYYLYGISTHSELGINTRLYLNDTYWPAVIAESGWLGFLCLLLFFVILFKEMKALYKIDARIYAAGIFIFVYMGITTVEETGFMQPVLMCLALLLGWIIGEKYRKNSEIGRDNRNEK